MSLKIRYKTIENERYEDAPFVGALISSIDCHFKCKECFNQRVKELPTIEKTAAEIIKEVKLNVFNTGVILAGLEWSEQIEECYALIEEALNNKLKVMLYTGNSLEQIKEKFPQLLTYDIYIKCGQFKIKKTSIDHVEDGVVLASDNQHIYKKGRDF